jgi:hypothetical protein
MQKEPEYNVLGKDFGMRKKVQLDNGLTIKIMDDDPYHYARVIDEVGNIVHETDMFNMDEDDEVLNKLKTKYK